MSLNGVVSWVGTTISHPPMSIFAVPNVIVHSPRQGTNRYIAPSNDKRPGVPILHRSVQNQWLITLFVSSFGFISDFFCVSVFLCLFCVCICFLFTCTLCTILIINKWGAEVRKTRTKWSDFHTGASGVLIFLSTSPSSFLHSSSIIIIIIIIIMSTFI